MKYHFIKLRNKSRIIEVEEDFEIFIFNNIYQRELKKGVYLVKSRDVLKAGKLTAFEMQFNLGYQ